MRILITDYAQQQLADIYEYYRLQGYGLSGRKIRAEVLKKALMLREFPNMGSIETNLEALGLGHRYMIVNRYKVIYRTDDVLDVAYITDVFDTRRDPSSMMP
jgi:toxin ParE1/3/4